MESLLHRNINIYSNCFFVCRDLQLDEYVDLYWRDYPSLISGFSESCLIDQGKTHLIMVSSQETRHVVVEQRAWSLDRITGKALDTKYLVKCLRVRELVKFHL